jgi:penicillin G amidase
MTKSIAKISPLLVSAIWLWFLYTPFKVGDNFLPPVGCFFSPSTGFWQNVLTVDATANRVIEDMPVSGSVVFDERMVPHIFAQNVGDAYFIQGYVHAMHRLWQMDFTTRAAEGRISEIIGEKAIEFDKNKRRKGLRESAMESDKRWKTFPEKYKLIQSYADGFNSYLNTLHYSDLPIEYKLMNYTPEKWSPYRTALFHKNMAEILCGRDSDVELTNAKMFFGKEFEYLFNEIDSLTDPVIPKNTKWNYTLENIETMDVPATSEIINWSRTASSSGIGSNNWAVSPGKTASGNPILCNDPHLFLTLPSVWYEQQIITPDLNVYGVTFPGVPGVIIGFNKSICWGVTNAGWDVMDWYKIQWKDSTRSEYLIDGTWKLPVKRIERIKVKAQNDVLDTVLITDWGPIVFDYGKHKKFGLAMHWIIQDPVTNFEISTFSDLNKAQNLQDYKEAIKQFPYPAQNFAFASTDGDIAITVQGNMPIKRNQQGRFVLDGSNSGNAWQGFLNNQYNPYCENPERGFISSANQRSTDLSFPNYYNNGDFRDYRGTIINRILASKNNWTVEDMMALQYNSYSLRAETALPYMLRALDSSQLTNHSKEIYDVLQKWNFNYDSNQIAPVYFEYWFQLFYKMVWDEVTMDSTLNAVGIPSDQRTIEFMKTRPDHHYFDLVATTHNENARDLLKITFDSLTYYCSANLKARDWAEYKNASIVHLSRIPAFGTFHLRTSGTKDVINAHNRSEGPSWRMIVELDKKGVSAWGIYPGGQSGHPGSQYYNHMITDWSQGKYYSLHFLDSVSFANSKFSLMEFKKQK